MSRTVIIERPGLGLVVSRVSFWTRVVARLRCAALDQALADGPRPWQIGPLWVLARMVVRSRRGDPGRMVDISTPLNPAPADHPPGSPATTSYSGEPAAGHRLVTGRPAREGGRRGAISVAVVDDHAAVRLGLEVAISSRLGLVCVGAVPDGELLPALLYRVRPDVVVLDYELPRVNGLELCRRIKADVPAPAVVLYSAYAGEALTIPALVAGVDAMVHKGAPALELFTAIEAVAGGEKRLPKPVSELSQAATGAIDAADRPLLELLLCQAPRPEIALRLALSAAELAEHIDRILDRLVPRSR